MKLSKIYANNSQFKTIIFNEGFNIVYGDVEDVVDKTTNKVQEHNLGKTSLINLIDFLLLKKVSQDTIFSKYKEKFSNWVFFLEIKLNNGEYLTIRRAVNPNTKISFKKHLSKNQNFTHEVNWDYEDLSLTSKDDEKNPKKILEKEYFKFDVNTDFNYRSFLPYLLRTQYDYQDVFRLNRFRGKDKDWKPALFQLLGFDSKLLLDKYDLDFEITEERKHIKKLKSKHDDSSNEVYKIKAAIEAKENEKIEIQKQIDYFDFYQKEKSINFDLVKNVENEISSLNKERYVLEHNIEKIQQSLDSKNKPSLQIDEIKKLYEEAKIFFPDNLAKDYQEVVDFTSQITTEREKYLKDELAELKEAHNKKTERLKQLNKERGQMLSVLKEKDTFKKYKKYQEDLVKIDNAIYAYQSKMEGIETIDNCQKSIDKTRNKIKEHSQSIEEEINKDNADYQKIKDIFQKIYKKTFEFTPLLVVAPNKNGNVEFETDVLNKSQSLTGKGDGYTSTKILCASFVLAILIHYSTKSFFRFAYHDGILESWGDNHKDHFIELIRSYCKEFDIQYVISLIKSDIPRNFKIENQEIIRTLSGDDFLFGFQF
jgi:uncharacterized protein YydD (DUF2326 family)